MPMQAIQYFEKKMRGDFFRWYLNIFLVFIIFSNAEVGRLLGMQGQPLAISAVWPATGFSLAALLIFGTSVWPGIFFGNLCYNLLHLFVSGTTFFGPLVTALFVSAGSLLQALFAGSVMRRFSSPGYFNTVRDVFIFLVPAGIVACFIASSVGITTLYVYGVIPTKLIAYAWSTFFIGDMMGVFIFTPLLVVWCLYPSYILYSPYRKEIVGMVFAMVVVGYLCFVANLPLVLFFIPISLWITYRFQLRGATLSVFAIALTSIIYTSEGYGTFVVNTIFNPLFGLVVFLEILVAITLILAAVINERDSAFRILEGQNIDLRRAVEIYSNQIGGVYAERAIRKKIATLCTLVAHIARYAHAQLKIINHATLVGLESLKKLSKLSRPLPVHEDSDLEIEYKNCMTAINASLESISQYEDKVYTISSRIHEQLIQPTLSTTGIERISINPILETCLNSVTNGSDKYPAHFAFTLIKELDPGATIQVIKPEALKRAIIILLHLSLRSLEEKIAVVKDVVYTPTLQITSVDYLVTIRDNGMGVEPLTLKSLLKSFMQAPPESISDFDITLAHDLIVYLYDGYVSVDSKLGEYLQITIKLPKLFS